MSTISKKIGSVVFYLIVAGIIALDIIFAIKFQHILFGSGSPLGPAIILIELSGGWFYSASQTEDTYADDEQSASLIAAFFCLIPGLIMLWGFFSGSW